MGKTQFELEVWNITDNETNPLAMAVWNWAVRNQNWNLDPYHIHKVPRNRILWIWNWNEDIPIKVEASYDYDYGSDLKAKRYNSCICM